MSFADPSLPRRPRDPRAESRARSAADADVPRRPTASQDDEQPSLDRPRGSPYRRTIDWEHVSLLGAGLVVGAIVGVGAALLFAPQSGVETRTAIRRQVRVAQSRAGDAWGDLADELAAAARRGRRRARRALRRARWRASDAIA